MFAIFFIFSLLLTFGWLVWVVLFLANDPVAEIYRTKRHQFLGPGGPDDPSAHEPYDDLI
jgi:hypothetical protein